MKVTVRHHLPPNPYEQQYDYHDPMDIAAMSANMGAYPSQIIAIDGAYCEECRQAYEASKAHRVHLRNNV